MLFAGISFISPQTASADDVPLPPSSFRASDGLDRYTFTWSKVGRVGANGNAVNPDNVTYVLEALDGNYDPQRVLVADKVLNYTLFYPTTKGEQDIMRFGLYARNSAGKSDYVYLKVVTGAPYNLPFHESFAIGATRGLCWQDGDGLFGVTSEYSADDDFGAMMCVPAADRSASSINLGKIALEHSLNPRLSFRMYGLEEGEKLNVRVARPDGQEASLLTINGPVDDWTTYTVDLKPLANQKYIIPKFQLAEGNENAILIDDIVISDPYTTDLGVIVRPADTSAENPTVRIYLENAGLTPVSGEIPVRVTVDDYSGTEFFSGTLAPCEKGVMEVRIPVKDTDPHEVKVRVEYPYDLNPYNDVASTQFVMDAPVSNSQASVEGILLNGEGPHRVYGLDGRMMKVASFNDLAPGIYIFEGKKIIIRQE